MNTTKTLNKLIVLIIVAFTIVLLKTYPAFSQPFKFHYNLKKCLNECGQFRSVHDLEKARVYWGLLGTNSDTTSIYRWKIGTDLKWYDIENKIKSGKVQINDTHDTLFFSPWYVTNDPLFIKIHGTKTEVAISDDTTYCFVIDWNADANKNIFGTYVLSIPFYYSQFAVTSLPFRFNIKDKAFSNDFLNANITYLFIFGKTKFFQSKFLEPRSNYWGFGPYIGASTIKDGADKDGADIFGFNYGLNAVRSIRNIDLSLALGAEGGFTNRYNSFIPYVGIGLGLKLIEFYEPENKKE